MKRNFRSTRGFHDTKAIQFHDDFISEINVVKKLQCPQKQVQFHTRFTLDFARFFQIAEWLFRPTDRRLLVQHILLGEKGKNWAQDQILVVIDHVDWFLINDSVLKDQFWVWALQPSQSLLAWYIVSSVKVLLLGKYSPQKVKSQFSSFLPSAPLDSLTVPLLLPWLLPLFDLFRKWVHLVQIDARRPEVAYRVAHKYSVSHTSSHFYLK